MKFDRVVEVCSELHCFSPGMITTGEPIGHIRVQLNRWTRSGKIIRLHKGWYILAAPYRKIRISMPVIACTIRQGSYVSFQSALAYHGMIPEYVPETTCITTGRPLRIITPLGRISYRHIKKDYFWGFHEILNGNQSAYIADVEKALVDLVYFTPESIENPYLEELRLQNLDNFHPEKMRQVVDQFGKPGLKKLPGMMEELIARNREEEVH